jgi:hypothetical protein
MRRGVSSKERNLLRVEKMEIEELTTKTRRKRSRAKILVLKIGVTEAGMENTLAMTRTERSSTP